MGPQWLGCVEDAEKKINRYFRSVNFYNVFEAMLQAQPKDDTWAFQKIGTAFPPNPVKVLGEQNMYVALWYKHGKPIHGRSWNNGGVVECSFPYKKAELCTAQQLEGNIQVLQYTGDHNSQGFWYEWIKYKDRLEKTEGRTLLHCGDSFPILWKDRPEGALLGYVDNKTEIALFSCDGKVYERKGPELNEMYIIMRNTVGGPPFCECENCAKAAPPAPAPPPEPAPLLELQPTPHTVSVGTTKKLKLCKCFTQGRKKLPPR
ncbi:hypothetical protein Y032_0402g806 [Ancylostoma ceylanicum]|uniref:Uncharacterized protein n=2 Tax=Ancylostoma ceylanicum TaxID=53326 RepID=A0A016X369_9BILA|nr:hypothetical protein Y032_0402g806 [Ancylostoma ceylanicum]